MINKKSLWFLTLFSLILVLSVYYVTMPKELLFTNGEDTNIKIEEASLLQTLRVEADEELKGELDTLKIVLNDSKSTAEEKNKAFDKMKELNISKTKELELEKLVEEKLKMKTFIKMKEDEIRVVVDSDTHDVEIANEMMRTIQSEFEEKKYITIEFKAP